MKVNKSLILEDYVNYICRHDGHFNLYISGGRGYLCHFLEKRHINLLSEFEAYLKRVNLKNGGFGIDGSLRLSKFRENMDENEFRQISQTIRYMVLEDFLNSLNKKRGK